MATLDLIAIIKKHGSMGVLVSWLLWTNMRLSSVENKLYMCYDKIGQTSKIDNYRTRYNTPQELYAILPNEIKIKKKDA